MIEPLRQAFNAKFLQQRYQWMLDDIAGDFDYMPTFRMAETPLFIPKTLKKQLLEGADDVIRLIQSQDFKAKTERALDLNKRVPNEDAHTTFLAVDFGICEEHGQTVPKLIEVQGFPSLFNYQFHLYYKFLKYYPILTETTPFFDGLDHKAYLTLLENAITNGHPKENVILLEIEPEKQNTKIDFYYCAEDFGIALKCVTDLVKKGRKLYYRSTDGNEVEVKRIYNRVIFDELDLRQDLKLDFNFTDDLDVEWAGHPNWFFRISKYILPMLKGPYFIETTLLSELNEIPADLENYVLKPLFSFSGSGVVFNVKHEDIDAVKDKDLYVLQKKVHYQPVVQSPDGKVKAEVRLLYIWQPGNASPTPVCTLVRLSRGEMIGVKYNKDKDWVGGTLGLFEKD